MVIFVTGFPIALWELGNNVLGPRFGAFLLVEYGEFWHWDLSPTVDGLREMLAFQSLMYVFLCISSLL